MKIVSACLAGATCRWDCSSKANAEVMELVASGKAIPVCPEQLGGLPTPRPPAEQKDGKVITKAGEDMTARFEHGANEALKIAKLAKCDEAILKSKSPSCGAGKVYDGTFSGNLVEGDGVFAKLLKENNIKVRTENEL
ncbi:MAG: DUF523 domain-containing protein [Candidatus ainarchaeum sp.]|nr:DUF523 domain-containing protein [Candidatus ainarchaeum sp.]